MIIIAHIDGVVSEKDTKKIPVKYAAKHSTGDEWLYFETIEEYQSFMSENYPTIEEV